MRTLLIACGVFATIVSLGSAWLYVETRRHTRKLSQMRKETDRRRAESNSFENGAEPTPKRSRFLP
jgi:hypothetical protein